MTLECAPASTARQEQTRSRLGQLESNPRTADGVLKKTLELPIEKPPQPGSLNSSPHPDVVRISDSMLTPTILEEFADRELQYQERTHRKRGKSWHIQRFQRRRNGRRSIALNLRVEMNAGGL